MTAVRGGPRLDPTGLSQEDSGVEVAGLSLRYGDLLALDRVDLSVPRHGRLGVVGPSGCGKSTLLSVLAGLAEAEAGTVSVLGCAAAAERLAHCALMPQRDLLLPWRSVLDNAGLALANRGVPRREARARVRPLFAQLGLAGFEDRSPRQLSGGMRQRVAFLRTLVADKEVLLLDEPFGALDRITRAETQQWLHGALRQHPRTVVLVTHDVEEALLLCDQVAVLSARPGRVLARLPVDLPPAASRRDVLALREFAALRERVLGALEQA